MAKKSAIARNKKRIRMVEKYSEIRNELKDIANSSKTSFEEKMEARRKLDLLPKNSSPVRVRNRCQKTGRPRGYMRFFGLSRISMRDLALRGHLPGIRKGSWKLVRLPDRLPLLFNLDNDPSEQNNVALENLDLVKSMLKELGDWDVSTPHILFLEGARWRRNQLDLYDKQYQLEHP